jgi:hypothetical protein
MPLQPLRPGSVSRSSIGAVSQSHRGCYRSPIKAVSQSHRGCHRSPIGAVSQSHRGLYRGLYRDCDISSPTPPSGLWPARPDKPMWGGSWELAVASQSPLSRKLKKVQERKVASRKEEAGRHTRQLEHFRVAPAGFTTRGITLKPGTHWGLRCFKV